ncbi:MAG TPA: nuclear transport factor 2 family protein [Gemmatimonadaceae bacterium]|nr:nuclear transport factor 2 family protein [Gemmatimonadaceae bacterium]
MQLRDVIVGPAVEEIVVAEEQLRAAQLAGDMHTLSRLIDDDLLFTGPNGELATKAQDLDAYRSGTVRFLAHDPQELRVRPVGPDVMVASLRARLEVSVAGTVAKGTYRYTRVWARGAHGDWRVVGGHVSQVAT